jgi:hypothetical protein
MCCLQEVQSNGLVNAQLTVQYPRAGRYIVRASATALDGAVHTRDLAVIIRKRGDNLKEAACCRNTAFVVAGAERSSGSCTATQMSQNELTSLLVMHLITSIIREEGGGGVGWICGASLTAL